MPQAQKTMSPSVWERMRVDMKLSGLAKRTQDAYIKAVRNLEAKAHRAADLLHEKEVQAHVEKFFDDGAARGTFKSQYYGIKFLFTQTLGCDWPLFKKRSASPNRSVFPPRFPIRPSEPYWIR